MKFKEIYDSLNECVEVKYQNKYCDELKIISNSKLLKLIDNLKDEVLKEEAKEAGSLKVAAAIKKILKTKATASRPILQKAVIRDDKMLFTDGYIAFELDSKIEGVEIHDVETEKRYPEFGRLWPECDKSFKLKLSDIIQKAALLKNDDGVIIKDDEVLKVAVQKKYINIVAAIMKIKKDDDIEFYYTTRNFSGGAYNKPLIIKNDFGRCLWLPIRTE
jgi:hypothetical protein